MRRQAATEWALVLVTLVTGLSACDAGSRNALEKSSFAMRFYLPGNPRGGDLVFQTPFGQKVTGVIPVPAEDNTSPFAAKYTLSFATPFPAETGNAVVDFKTGAWEYTPAPGFSGDVIVPYRLDATHFGRVAEGRLIIQVGNSLQRLRPALAVRATGCITCHAQVRSTVITDFGAGDPFFFGANGPYAAHNGMIYGNHGDQAWQSAQIWGDVIVPKATVKKEWINAEADQSLADYLRARVSAPDAQTPAPTVKERERVKIAAPTQELLRGLLGESFAPQDWRFQKASPESPDFGGLELVTEGGTYLTNSPDSELTCDGDLIVDRPLLLRRLHLETIQGCRIYALHSVFIEGAIDYGDSPETANLQIASSRAIIMGLGKMHPDGSPGYIGGGNGWQVDTLQFRLLDFWTTPGYYLRGENTPRQNAEAIVADAAGMELLDATNEPEGRGVAFERLALIAPNVQSRYNGDFSGSIVAEIALFALGDFHFAFDPVFLKVPILPLLPASAILDVSDE